MAQIGFHVHIPSPDNVGAVKTAAVATHFSTDENMIYALVAIICQKSTFVLYPFVCRRLKISVCFV